MTRNIGSAASKRRPMHRRNPSTIAIARRRALIEAAIRSIAEKGFAAVTVAMICEEAGFSRGLIGHYFKSKDDLLLEAIKVVSHGIAEANKKAVQAAGDDPRARLHAIVRSSFSPPVFEREQVLVWVALVGSASWSESLATVYRDLWRQYQVGIAGLISKAASGRSNRINANLAALHFARTIEGFWVGWASDPSQVTPAKAQKSCHNMVDFLVGAASNEER